ncbi:hypothetical protein ACI3L1_14370 [Deinococcus sp. SM5_A1]|uniref:hypothetical protein n=1 Tax=Deinococcus sp. SM5_A1 TaxID=3379094 RepID=UPI00385D0D6A
MANWEKLAAVGLPIEDENARLGSIEIYLKSPSFEKMQFAVEVIADSGETWAMRAEVCRFVCDIESKEWPRTNLSKAIYEILSDHDENLTLRQWAAFNVGKCQEDSELVKIASDLIADSEDLRWNIIDSLNESEIIVPEMRSSLKKISMQNDVGDEIRNAVLGFLT